MSVIKHNCCFPVHMASIKKTEKMAYGGRSSDIWNEVFASQDLFTNPGRQGVTGWSVRARAQAMGLASQTSVPSKPSETLSWSFTSLTHTIGMMISRAAYLVWKNKMGIGFLAGGDPPGATLFFSFSDQFQSTDVIGRLWGLSKTMCAMILAQYLAHRSRYVIAPKMIKIASSPCPVWGAWG